MLTQIKIRNVSILASVNYELNAGIYILIKTNPLLYLPSVVFAGLKLS